MKNFFWNLPAWIDRWRLWPRAMITTYLWLIVETSLWFMGLPLPTTAQAGFASAVLGVGAAWFGLYLQKPGATRDL